MSEAEKPVRRGGVGGFMLAVAGGLIAGAGAVLTWALVTVGKGGISVQTRGTDLPEGKVALAAGVVILIGALALRVGKTNRGRPGAGIAILVGGIAATITGAIGWTSTSRYGNHGVSAFNSKTDAFTHVTRGAGPLVTIVGGILAIAGGTMAFAWARKSRGDPVTEPGLASQEEPETP